ncbi:BTAD domain-containing putative transcriptional regulator [Streptomyces sp. NPDC058665]|uniref:AfsR/SARP family transcriptional regulator n=1 Tax=Streptomyces sp. NPDC058665 TaxID=3346586 RepID=UPI0036515AE1
MSDEDRMPVRFNILGTLECRTEDTRLLPLGGPVPERVLASLLLSPNRVVPVGRLVEAVWETEPPSTASHQVRKAVGGLRHCIPGGRELIVTERPGYQAVVSREQLDLLKFSDGLRRAQLEVTAGHTAAAVATLRDTLALWRGPVLAGAGGSLIDVASAGLEERRLAAVEQYFELRLSLGETSELIGELRIYVNNYQFMENLRVLLMLALYRSGRQAEALSEYYQVCKLLAGELGVDPSSRLTTLYEKMLRQAPELAALQHHPAPAPRSQDSALVKPTGPHRCTLPCDLPDFTGRDQEIQQLLRYVKQSGNADRLPGAGFCMAAVDGMGGSGKTSLVIRAAHRLADRYPDAHLYVDLRGFSPGEEPLQPYAVAEILLRMLDVPGERIPADAGSRFALWRATAAQRRLILVLDNAVNSEQVRPLLPGPSDSLVLITSRPRLVELDGAHWMSLGVMHEKDSTALVSRILGEGRLASEPEAVAELVELCGHLPLALRIAAARLCNRPSWTVRYLVERLSDESCLLDELHTGVRSVSATLALSYETLEPAHRSVFELLAGHPGAEIDPYSAGALLGMDPENAEKVLELLLDVHLMQQYETGRYAFHDLVRYFAQSLGRKMSEERAQAHTSALERLLGYYVGATDAACDVLFPGRAPLSRTASEPSLGSDAVLPYLGSPRHAQRWLEREEDNLLAAVSLADRKGLRRHTHELARNVVFGLDRRGRFEEFQQVAATAVEAARELDDPLALAHSLSNLAVVNWKLGRFADGLWAAQESCELSVRLGDRRGEAKGTGVMGLLLATLGYFDKALPHLEQSIGIKQELGARRAEAESLTNLSSLFEHWGRYEEAAEAAHRAVELNRVIGAPDNEIISLSDLALAHLGLGDDEAAHNSLDQALELSHESGSLADIALIFALSAKAHRNFGKYGEAVGLAERAWKLERQIRMPTRKAAVRNILGSLFGHRHQHDTALQLHTDAHEVALSVGFRIEVARALDGMAEVLTARGDIVAAFAHRTQADAMFAAMGVPETSRLHG